MKNTESDKTRTKIYTFVYYPEHNPEFENFVDTGNIIKDTYDLLIFLLSQEPIFETVYLSYHHAWNNGDQKERSDHVHVMLRYTGVKYNHQVRLDLIKCGLLVPLESLDHSKPKEVNDSSNYKSYSIAFEIKKLSSWKSMARYLIHKDNPEKEQFPDGVNHVRAFGSGDYLADVSNQNDIIDYSIKLQELVDQYSFDWVDLNKYLRSNIGEDLEAYELFKVLNTDYTCNNSTWKYISSNLKKIEREQRERIAAASEYLKHLGS